MSFGKNPHVAKAQAAEQKAQAARDDAARTLAWREAARLWDRAAERENSDARKKDYSDRAQAAREAADADGDFSADATEPVENIAAEDHAASDPRSGAHERTTHTGSPAPAAGKGPSRWLN